MNIYSKKYAELEEFRFPNKYYYYQNIGLLDYKRDDISANSDFYYIDYFIDLLKDYLSTYINSSSVNKTAILYQEDENTKILDIYYNL